MTHVIHARGPRGDIADAAIDRSPEALAAHLADAAHFAGGRADGLARPRAEADVAALLASANHVLPIGAQSSVTGGATPAGGLLVSTDRLNAIQKSGVEHVTAGAGVPLEVVQQVLRERGRWFPPVPTFTGAFVGGVVATNAAGAATFKYGTTRTWVDAVTVVLPCGHVLDIERGQVRADGRDGFSIRCGHGERAFRPPTYAMPVVPKCSAGYFAAPDMDLIDLFIGSEGTLGAIVSATLRTAPLPAASILALVPVQDDATGLALVTDLREQSRRTWTACDANGIDVAAIEHLDRRCLELLREDGVDRANDVSILGDTALLLLVRLEFAESLTAAVAYDQIAGALVSPSDSSLARFCRALKAHGVLERTELAMPGDTRRTKQFLTVREGAPLGVNRRVGDARRLVDPRIDKTAGDMVVPFDRFDDMMAMYHEGFQRRGLDYAIWGHISDGNVHPNVLPRTYDDVLAGRKAMLEFGREVVRMGGSPLAEHGVGRSHVKQALLRQMYGDAGIGEMRAIKRAIDPDGKMAPGVIFPS